jgi:hypothetical protein
MAPAASGRASADGLAIDAYLMPQGSVADRAGPYVVTSSVESSEPDPNPSNNTSTFRFEVAASGGSGPTRGGTAVSAGAVKLTPKRPKAGTVVVASVRVTAGGSPVRPTGLSCAGTISGAKVVGTPRSAAGTAACRYRTPKAAKGKTIRGTISFTARGKKFTKRFAAKLG